MLVTHLKEIIDFKRPGEGAIFICVVYFLRPFLTACFSSFVRFSASLLAHGWRFSASLWAKSCSWIDFGGNGNLMQKAE